MGIARIRSIRDSLHCKDFCICFRMQDFLFERLNFGIALNCIFGIAFVYHHFLEPF